MCRVVSLMSAKVLGLNFDPDRDLFLEVFHRGLGEHYSLLDIQGVFAYVWAHGGIMQVPASDLELTDRFVVPREFVRGMSRDWGDDEV